MRKFPLALLLFSAFCLKGMADTITLKNGTVIEGTITQQDDRQVTVNIKVSDSISDVQVLQRDDITKIEKTSEDSLAFETLKSLKPDPMAMLSPEAYQSAIDDVKAFLDKYPDSDHKADAQAILDVLSQEQAHQQAGDVKLYGNWIPKKEVAAHKLQIQAQAIYLKMQATAAQGDLIGALNMFDLLERTDAGARVFPTAVVQVKNYQAALQGEVNTAVANLKTTDEQWKQGVIITPEPEKSEMVAARQGELAKYDAILASAQKTQKWPPYIPKSQTSLDAISAMLVSEEARLGALPVDSMTASIEQSDKADGLIATRDLANASSILKNAITLWPANDDAVYQLKAVAVMQAPAPSPVPGVVARTPAPKTAVITPTPTAKPKVTPVGAPTPEPQAKQGLVDFLFTIPGAITVVLCAVGLIAVTSYLQKSKRDRMGEEEEEATGPKS